MNAGKPQKQAVAIAYSEKREAEHHKMNHGGMVDECGVCMPDGREVSYDEGGEVEGPDMDDELSEMAAGELLEALEKKDKKEILESIRAIVLSVR